MTERAVVGEIKLPSTGFWRSLFKLDEVTLPHADPLHCDAPVLRHAEIAAVYSGQRVAGDFYEFLWGRPECCSCYWTSLACGRTRVKS